MRVSYSGTRRPKPSAPRADHDLYERIEEDAVHDVMKLPPGTTVVHGAEPTGIDAAVGRAARELGLPMEEHPPDLAAHGGDFRRAALARNVYVTTVGADGEARFFAGPDSRGTWHAWGLAERAGIRRRMRAYQRDGGVRVLSWPERLPNRLRVRSGNLRTYVGPGLLDVTRGSGRGPALAFAPSRGLLDPALLKRRVVRDLLARAAPLRNGKSLFDAAAKAEADALLAEAAAAENALWEPYRAAFVAEMRVSAGLSPSSPRWGALEEAAVARGVRPQPDAWRALLAGKLGSYDVDGAPLVVACCYCFTGGVWADHCHAHVLRQLWAAMGAEDGGEAVSTVIVGVVCR